MDTDRFYTIFNTKIVELLNDLIILFPDDSNFKMYKTAINLAKLADEKKPLQYYNKFVTEEYKQHIRTKNDKFFLDNDYKEILGSSELSSEINMSNFSSQIVDRLKGYWSKISDENKEIVWNYFNIFLKISEKV